MSRRWKLLLGGLLLAGVAGFYVLLNRPAPAPVPAASAAGPAGVGALGRIEPAGRLRRLSPSAGPEGATIARLLVAEGDRVAAGQVLAEFVNLPEKQAALAQAEANAALAEARLARLLAGGRAEEVAAGRARVAAALAAEESARREAERAERLRGTAVFNEAVFDRTRFAAAQAAAERARAEADLRALLGPRPEDVTVAEAELAAARAQATQARAERDKARLVSPIAGTVLRIPRREGEKVADDTVMEIADLTALDVVADVFETDLPRVRQGAAAEVTVPGEPRPFGGTVREVGWTVRRNMALSTDPVAATDARIVEVRVALDQAAVAALARRTNMVVQVAIRP